MDKTKLNKRSSVCFFMKKIIYSGSPIGLYSTRKWDKFLMGFEEIDCIRKREGTNYDYRIDNIISGNVVSKYTFYKSRKLQINRNKGSRIKIIVSGSEENISEFEKTIEEAEKEH